MQHDGTFGLRSISLYNETAGVAGNLAWTWFTCDRIKRFFDGPLPSEWLITWFAAPLWNSATTLAPCPPLSSPPPSPLIFDLMEMLSLLRTRRDNFFLLGCHSPWLSLYFPSCNSRIIISVAIKKRKRHYILNLLPLSINFLKTLSLISSERDNFVHKRYKVS